MHIAIDACCLGRKKTGNETYIRGLLSGFELLLAQSTDPSNPNPPPSSLPFHPTSNIQISVLTTAAYPGDRAACFDWIDIPLGNFLTRNFVTIPGVLKRLNPDLYHGVYWSRFFAQPVPTVLMVHDLSFVSFPQGFRPHEQWVYANLVRACAKSARHVLTVSEFSKRELIRHWGIAPEKITVTYDGLDACYSPREPATRHTPHASVASSQLIVDPPKSVPSDIIHPPSSEIPLPAQVSAFSFQLSLPYILYVGNLHPRKNIVRLLEAFIKVRQSGEFPHRLRIVGQATWMAGDVFSTVRESGFAEEVDFTGYVSYEKLTSLYQNAAVCVYPSLYEGFGLPVLEAMACGCSVVCSNTTSVPEVAGDAAILVNPESVDDIAAGIRRVLTESGLAESLRERGIAQAQKFTWQACAEETLAAYQAACGGGGRKS